MAGSDHRILGKSAVAFRSEIPGSVQLLSVRLADAGLDQDPFADPVTTDLLANDDNMPAGVGALNARELDWRS